MKQNRECGEKKLANRSISFILALVFVFSIFSGMTLAEEIPENCDLVDVEVSEECIPTADPVDTMSPWRLTDCSCEKATWEKTVTTTTEGYIKKTITETYECCCEGTGKCEYKKNTYELLDTVLEPCTIKEEKKRTAYTPVEDPFNPSKNNVNANLISTDTVFESEYNISNTNTTTTKTQLVNGTLSNKIDDILKLNKSVFVYFYAERCHLCQQEKQIIDELEKEYAGKITFIRINGEDNLEAKKEFRVNGFPTMFVILSKEEKGQYEFMDFRGFTDKETLKKNIDWIITKGDIKPKNFENSSSKIDNQWETSSSLPILVNQEKLSNIEFLNNVQADEGSSDVYKYVNELGYSQLIRAQKNTYDNGMTAFFGGFIKHDNSSITLIKVSLDNITKSFLMKIEPEFRSFIMFDRSGGIRITETGNVTLLDENLVATQTFSKAEAMSMYSHGTCTTTGMDEWSRCMNMWAVNVGCASILAAVLAACAVECGTVVGCVACIPTAVAGMAGCGVLMVGESIRCAVVARDNPPTFDTYKHKIGRCEVCSRGGDSVLTTEKMRVEVTNLYDDREPGPTLSITNQESCLPKRHTATVTVEDCAGQKTTKRVPYFVRIIDSRNCNIDGHSPGHGDGWYCINGGEKEYRDYTCSNAKCVYDVTKRKPCTPIGTPDDYSYDCEGNENINIGSTRVQSAPLNSDKLQIREYGTDEFTIAYPILFNKNGTLFDYRSDIYTTSASVHNNYIDPKISSAKFTGNYSDHGADTDNDGLYNYLTVDVGINITTAENYTLSGWLYDVHGNIMVWSINSTLLDTGNQTLQLNFDGKTIQRHGVDGPYYLKDLTLFDKNWNQVDYISDAYTTTSAYNYTDFQTPLAEFTNSHSDYGTDTDSDGLYNNLTLDVGVKVTTAGNYTLSGWLCDVNGSEIVESDKDSYLHIGNQTLQLNFDGLQIREHEVDGPFNLCYLVLLGEDVTLIDYRFDAYTTSLYNYADFQSPVPPVPLAELTGDYADYGTDIDGNGLYENLTIDVGVDVNIAGNYSVEGLLCDANGSEIVWADNKTYLDLGAQTVLLNFDGLQIRKYEKNTSFNLSFVVLLDENGTIIDYRSGAYTTSAYNYTDFEKPPAPPAPPAAFTGDYADYGTDIDGDELYDYLAIDVGVNVTATGNYIIVGRLYDVNENNITGVINYDYLHLGNQTLQLNFDGKTIKKHGVNGPYYLKNLTIFDASWDIIDDMLDAYTTSVYNYTDFQTLPIQPAPPAAFTGDYADYGTDTDGDGLYDFLTIDVGVNVTTAGNYSLDGWLYDANGSEIVWAYNDAYLDVGVRSVLLNFGGMQIRKHRVDGPFNIGYLTLLDKNGTLCDYRYDIYNTSAYNYTDFEIPLAELTSDYSDYGADTDGDGLYDYLMIDIGVNVTDAGVYILKGWLYDVSENDITSAVNHAYLDTGNKTLQLNFNGKAIQKHEVDGVYYLKNLSLYDGSWNLLDYISDAYTTSAYNHTDFQVPLAEFTSDYADYGIDTDGDGLYDYLTIDVGVNVITAGDYSLMGWLYDANGSEIVWSIDYVSLDVGNHTMHLDFNGKTIQMHGVNGPYYLKDLTLSSGENWTFIDSIPDAYTTSAYNYTDFVDPVSTENEVTISGVGLGEIRLIVSFKETIPVFAGRYSYDLVGINVPQRPNNFTITTSEVKNLKVGVKKIQDNTTRIWVTQTIVAPEGIATVQSDLPSPGNYHVKIFGDAAEGVSEVDLELTAVKKIKASGDFSLSIDISGFPAGKYTVTATADTGCFTDLTLEGLPLDP